MLDPKWLDALKLPLRVTAAIAVSSAILLACNLVGLLDLGPLTPYARPALIILPVVFGALSLVAAAEPLIAPLRERQRQSLLAARRASRKKREDEKRAAVEQIVLARLDHLSAEEIHYVADCLRKGTPSFYTYVNSPAVSMMQGKMLVWTPGGTHHQDHYPFSFYDFVWAALLARQAEFTSKDDDHQRAKAEAERTGRRRTWT